MQRRRFLQGLLAAPLAIASLESYGQEAGAVAASKLPFKRVSVKEDFEKVVFFFDFSCPYSAQYHIPMMNWEKTVPKLQNGRSVQVDFVPAINLADERRKKDMALAAAGFYAAMDILKSREQIRAFVESIYDSRQRDGIPITASNLWETACKKAGIPPKLLFNTAAQGGFNRYPKSSLVFAAKRLVRYKVTATPTVGVGGQFTLNPDDVQGDVDMFFNVLNGLASNYLLS